MLDENNMQEYNEWMDDVNMLAFLDLMKYQIQEKDGAIDQMFFVTCDARISRLIKYKFEGAKILIDEINEAQFR